MKSETAARYLKVILKLEKQQGTVRSLKIAEEMHVTRPTVCVTLRELMLDGYITMQDSHEITLTESGRSIALHAMERYQFFHNLLLGMGVTPQIAERDAGEMGSVISEESYQAMRSCKELGQS